MTHPTEATPEEIGEALRFMHNLAANGVSLSTNKRIILTLAAQLSAARGALEKIERRTYGSSYNMGRDVAEIASQALAPAAGPEEGE